jgi:hypothetical protein
MLLIWAVPSIRAQAYPVLVVRLLAQKSLFLFPSLPKIFPARHTCSKHNNLRETILNTSHIKSGTCQCYPVAILFLCTSWKSAPKEIHLRAQTEMIWQTIEIEQTEQTVRRPPTVICIHNQRQSSKLYSERCLLFWAGRRWPTLSFGAMPIAVPSSWRAPVKFNCLISNWAAISQILANENFLWGIILRHSLKFKHKELVRTVYASCKMLRQYP